MSRYIDADRFAEKMKRQYCENCDNYQGIRCKACPNGDWLDDLYDQPTADVVEVVRCKDCKYWQDQEEGIVEVPICTKEDCSIIIMGENDFCSKGERKDD